MVLLPLRYLLRRIWFDLFGICIFGAIRSCHAAPLYTHAPIEPPFRIWKLVATCILKHVAYFCALRASPWSISITLHVNLARNWLCYRLHSRIVQLEGITRWPSEVEVAKEFSFIISSIPVARFARKLPKIVKFSIIFNTATVWACKLQYSAIYLSQLTNKSCIYHI